MKRIIFSLTLMAGFNSASYALSNNQIMANFKNSIASPGLYSRSNNKKPFWAINSSIDNPNAAGSTERSVFVGLGYIKSWTQTNTDNLSFILGTTFGNAKKNIGVLMAITSPLTENGSFSFKNHTISVRLNRYLNKYITAAIGAENLLGINRFNNFAKSYYAVITANTQSSFLPIMASIGVGSGGFNSIENARDGNDDYYSAFYNLGIGLRKNWSLIANWTAESLSLGTTYIFNIDGDHPIGLNIGVMNVAGTLPQGEKRNSVAISLAYAYVY